MILLPNSGAGIFVGRGAGSARPFGAGGWSREVKTWCKPGVSRFPRVEGGGGCHGGFRGEDFSPRPSGIRDRTLGPYFPTSTTDQRGGRS